MRDWLRRSWVARYATSTVLIFMAGRLLFWLVIDLVDTGSVDVIQLIQAWALIFGAALCLDGDTV